MSRDNVKSDQYFEKYIVEQNARIKKFENILATIPVTDEKRRSQCERYLANYYKDLLTAEYSAGHEKEQVKSSFKNYISSICQCNDIGYAELVDVLALSIILKTNVESVIKKECAISQKDELISFLLGESVIDKPESGELLHEEYYRIFMDYALDKVTTQEFLNYIENSWYASSKDFSWYNSHESKEDVYVGYWCWLAEALFTIKHKNVKGKYIPN